MPRFTCTALSCVVLPFQASANARASTMQFVRPVGSPPNCLADWVLTFAQDCGTLQSIV
jgi:hypothetical protein